MFSQSKQPTISLPLYNIPRTPRIHPNRITRSRFLAIGLFASLVFVTFVALSKAAPLIRNNARVDSELLRLQDAAVFQENMDTVAQIYRGTEKLRDNIDHLIIVPGHAILLDKFNYMSDDAWVLETFQKGGHVQTYVDHIIRGVEMVKDDVRSLLVFSGYVSVFSR